MPLFEEDPAHLSKSRLRSDLVAHSVALPPAKSRKRVYVELHSKHINSKSAAEFSSDEEDLAHNGAEKEKDPEDVGILDPVVLSDADLKAALFERGVKAGPIVASTRAVYENKLRKLLQADGQEVENGLEEGVLYSDSEEEKEEGPVGAEKEQPIEQQDQTEEEIREPPAELAQDVLKDTYPIFKVTPIYATCRKPIKGAAGRPIQHVYPDSPASPTTLERKEVERRLVPIYVQIVVFLVAVVLLYLINICVEDNSFNPLLALLDGLNEGWDSEEGLSLQAETQDAPSISG
ncbi:LEM domain-containing protein 1 isoform X1 [Antennarius striatus]|uniref:LEM domain-containing protein 1 isoform X1 n=1 Tax=Antennarius striatus TaxID=241820 RepID=UPI0035B0FB22